MPVGIPLDGMRAMIAQRRQLAKAAARNPDSLEVIVGANAAITAEPLGADRPIFAGSRAQVQGDITAVKDLGASEIFFIIFPDGSIKDLIGVMERYRTLA
jgi:alkanesulfonate monooxygenase SsuD/methylene tetrahydromethanopterin reductase-like flavin-dependent oxidoreductase (luciferase family)